MFSAYLNFSCFLTLLSAAKIQIISFDRNVTYGDAF